MKRKAFEMFKNRVFIRILALVLVCASFALAGCRGDTPTLKTDTAATSTQTEAVSETATGKLPSPTDMTAPESTSEPESTPTPETPTPAEPVVVSKSSFLFAGDNLLHRGIIRDGLRNAAANEDFNFDFIYEFIAPQVQAADYAFINQEAIIIPKDKIGGKPESFLDHTESTSFCSPPEVLDALAHTGFDGIVMANNHMLDQGAGGLQWAIDYSRTREDLNFFGGYYDEADRSVIRTIKVGDITIAVLAYTYGTNVSSERAARHAPEFKFLVPYIEDERILSDLKKAEEIADFTLVQIHWGNENKFYANDEQKRLAKLMAENGADLIIGHHSHTLQPIEYIPDGKGGEVLCVYSLGTLMSNMAHPRNMLAGLFTCNLVLWSDGHITVEDPLLTPTVFYYNMSYRQSKIFYLKQMTDERCSSHGIGNYPKDSSKKNKMVLETLYEYVHTAVDDRFLPDEYKKNPGGGE